MEKGWKRNTIRFLASQTISLLGTSLVQYAITWYITLTTQSGLMITISIIFGFLPYFLLSPFSGVWADRYSRKKLIVLADGGIAASTLILALLFMVGIENVWLLIGISAIRSFGSSIQTPCVDALIPQLVPEDKLTRVNALNATIQSVIALVSPMLSGVLLAVTTIETVFFIDVFTATVAIVILLVSVNVPPLPGATKTAEHFDDLKSGLAYIRGHAFALRLIIFSAVMGFLMGPATFLTPLQVTRSFNGGVFELSAIEVTFSAGMVLGGLMLSAWGGFKNRMHTIILGTAALSMLTIGLGIVPVFWIYAALMGLIGVTVPMIHTTATVLLQEKVNPDYMGRVFAALGMITSGAMPLSMLVFGPVADVVAIEWLLIITGLLLLLITASFMGSKSLMKAGEQGEREHPLY